MHGADCGINPHNLVTLRTAFTAIRKEARLFCGSFLQKGVVLAYVGLSQNLKDLKDSNGSRDLCESFLRKGEVFAYLGLIQNLKDLKRGLDSLLFGLFCCFLMLELVQFR